MSRLIISCPICEAEHGVIYNLAEYVDGMLSIRTHYKTHKGETIPMYVQGDDFKLICGYCKSVAFNKSPILISETTQVLFGTV